MRRAAEETVLVDLVGNGEQVVLAADGSHLLQLGGARHVASRVVRRI